MAKYIEPHVSSIEQVTVIGSNSVQSTTNRVLCIFIADCGPLEPTEIENQSEFLKTYTNGGEISRRAHRSFFHALKHAQAFPLMCLRVTADKATKGITNKGTKIFTKGDKILNYPSSAALDYTFGAESKAKATYGPENWVIKIGEFIFAPDVAVGGEQYLLLYTDQDTSVPIEPEYNSWPSKANATFADLKYFVSQVVNYLNKYTNFVANVSFTETGETPKCSITTLVGDKAWVAKSSIETQQVTVSEVAVPLTNVSFVISPNAPATTNLFEVAISDITSFTANGLDYYRFALTVNAKGETSTYNLSTYPDDNDATGANMYLTAFNDYQNDLKIIPVHDNVEVTPLTRSSFGATDAVTQYDQNTIPLNLLSDAIATVEEIEGIRISLISDCGMCQPAYQKKLSVLAETLKALPALSCPDSPLIPYVTNYVKSVGIDSSFAWFGWPWNVDRALCEFPVDLSPVCYYIERISANASGNAEFAPVFGKTTGVSTGRNIKSNPTLKQRNELQSYNINPLYYDKNNNICYFKNDLTQLSAANVLQEEQTRRIINKIRYEVDSLCDTYLSYDWDEASCYKIKGAIESYFDNVIYKMLRTIEPNPVVTVTLTTLNHVKVEVAIRPKGSIKYIMVYYNILSMAS